VQIIGKAKDASFEALQQTITSRLRESLPESIVASVVVKPVFPGLTSGRRAGMFTVDLPDSVSAKVVDSIIDSLRRDAAVEYAQLPAEKRPM
jgi:hypothetical protein